MNSGVILGQVLQLATEMYLLVKTCGRLTHDRGQHDTKTILMLILMSIFPSILGIIIKIIKKYFPEPSLTWSDQYGVLHDGTSEAPEYIEILDLYQDLAADDKRCEVLLFDLKNWIKCKWLGAHNKIRQHKLTQNPPGHSHRRTVENIIKASLATMSKVGCAE